MVIVNDLYYQRAGLVGNLFSDLLVVCHQSEHEPIRAVEPHGVTALVVVADEWVTAAGTLHDVAEGLGLAEELEPLADLAGAFGPVLDSQSAILGAEVTESRVGIEHLQPSGLLPFSINQIGKRCALLRDRTLSHPAHDHLELAAVVSRLIDRRARARLRKTRFDLGVSGLRRAW
jgi:hypothetical protein